MAADLGKCLEHLEPEATDPGQEHGVPEEEEVGSWSGIPGRLPVLRVLRRELAHLQVGKEPATGLLETRLLRCCCSHSDSDWGVADRRLERSSGRYGPSTLCPFGL